MRRAAWSISGGSGITCCTALLDGDCVLATAMRVVGGNGFAVLTGRYAGVASALAWGSGLGFGSDLGASACGGRLALRASAFAVLAAWGLSVAAGLVAMRCWYVVNARHVASNTNCCNSSSLINSIKRIVHLRHIFMVGCRRSIETSALTVASERGCRCRTCL